MSRQMASRVHSHPGLNDACVHDEPRPTGWRAVVAVIGLAVFLLIEFAAILAILFAGQAAVR